MLSDMLGGLVPLWLMECVPSSSPREGLDVS